ncbi:MAG: protein kinase family protein GAF domain-containing [Planctomycetota bacterium]|nr:MAG: protein kinase family protein GAF domain-containing [Planctomycetota bacterium]
MSEDEKKNIDNDLATTRSTPPPPAPPGAGALPALSERSESKGSAGARSAPESKGPPLPTDSSVLDTRQPPSDPGPTRVYDSRGAAPPRRFGRYEILAEVARGGMGIVFRARQTDVNRIVALKLLLHGGLASEEDEKRFAHEAELSARLSHPNIVAIHDFGREGGRLFFTMEYVEGEPLDRWAKGRSLPEVLRAAAKACRAAHHAHMHGVIHRDLKPGNILVTPGGEPKLLDFGLAKGVTAVSPTMSTASGATIGTPFYMAPEQADGRVKDIDIRTDVYALGVVLYQLVAGEVPFRGATMIEVAQKILQDEAPALEAAPDLATVIGKAMAKEKHLRYPTAEALAEDLEHFIAGEPVSARAPGLSVLAKRWARRHPASIAGLVAVVATLAAVGGWWWSRDGEVAFEVDAPGAWVEVDGARVAGSGPVRVRPGEHVLVAGADGREAERREVVVGRGERRTHVFRLPVSTGRLTLETGEPGTFVTILGENHGTPLTNHPFPVGRHHAVIRRSCDWSRFVDVDIRRNESTEVWRSVPVSGSWGVRFPDGGATECLLRDVNGDGVPDVSGSQYNVLVTYDGRNGAPIFLTRATDGTSPWNLKWFDADRDGIEDDVVATTFIPGGIALPKGRIQVFSGSLDKAEAAKGPKGAVQRELWRKEVPVNLLSAPIPPVLPCSDGLWVGFPEWMSLLQWSNGDVIAKVPFHWPTELASTFGGRSLAFRDGEIARLPSGGGVSWRIPVATGARPVRSLQKFAARGFANPMCMAGDRSIFALDLADGQEVWRAETGPAIATFEVPAGSGTPRLVAAWGPKWIQAWDAAKGGTPWTIPLPWSAELVKSAAAGPGCLFTIEDGALVSRSFATGDTSWRRPLGAEVIAGPVAHEGGLESRVAIATKDLRLRVFDAAGRDVSEFSLPIPSNGIQPVDADGYGEEDYIVAGYGYTLARGSRVLWRRSFGNSVRPRPVAIPLGRRLGLAIAMRGNDGSSELRCLDARTGEMIWRAGRGFDCIYEPLVHDADRDGILDIALTCFDEQGVTALRVHSGKDGRAIFTCPTRGGISYGQPAYLGDDDKGLPTYAVFPMNLGVARTRAGAKDLDWTSDADLVMTGSALADLDGDGRPEVIFAYGSADLKHGWVAAVKQDGKKLWTAETGEFMRSTPAAIDLDRDGRVEVLAAGAADLHVFDAKGRRVRRWEKLGGSYYSPILCDLSGHPEDPRLLIGTKTGVVMIRTDGEPRWSYSSASVVGALGVIYSPAGARSVAGIDRDGRLFLLDVLTGDERFRLSVGDFSEGGILLADADGDGMPEGFFGTNDGWLTSVDLR